MAQSAIGGSEKSSPPSLPLLLFDVNAVLEGKTREWQDYSRVGECFLPQLVLEEIRFLCSHALAAAQEQVAREFARFYPSSGWQTVAVQASHPALKSDGSQFLSKRARQSLAVAQCAYALSQDYSSRLVVLVTNDQSILQRLQIINMPNFCGITIWALLQWVRTDRLPVAVTQRRQVIEHVPSLVGTQAGGEVSIPKPVAMKTRTTTTSPSRQYTQQPRRTKPIAPSRRTSSAQAGSGFIALVGFLVAGVLVWGFLQPKQFMKTWKQLGLPPLPNGLQHPAPK